MVINVSTKLGKDLPLSDDKVSQPMDAQIKPSAAVRLQHVEATSTFIYSTSLGKKRSQHLQLTQREEKRHKMKVGIRRGHLNVRGRLNQFTLPK